MSMPTVALLLGILFPLKSVSYYHNVEAFTIQSSPQQLMTTTRISSTSRTNNRSSCPLLQMSSTNPSSSFPPYRPPIQPPTTPLTGDANVINTVAEGTPTQPRPQKASSYSRRGMAGKKGARRVTLRRYLNGLVKTHPELRDLESLSLSIQMSCKTISNLVNRNGINTAMPQPAREEQSEERSDSKNENGSTFITSGGNDNSSETITNMDGQNNLRMNSMKRLDQLSTNVLRNALRFTGKLQMVKPAKDNADGGLDEGPAEHQPGVLIASALDSKYVAYFDPLDGSGNADATICTGTVFGIFETNEEEDNDQFEEGIDNVVLGGGDGIKTVKSDDFMVNSVLQPGRNLVAAGYCLYSSATILVFTMGDGTHGFTLDPQINEFVLTHPNIRIPSRGSIYSCNEANSETWSNELKEYVRALKTGENETNERYASRYIGSMVGDIHRTLMYGGIFFYPSDACHPNGNLQLLYKSAPMSYVIEQAGGASTNGKINLLDVCPNRVHQRSPCFIGSPEDINEMKKFIPHSDD
eukprot:CAMPEP_0203677176 /NCGR_PEP_ID=MMETSP0090-20130426/27267_1 /ASSEMBLY_ACC=CAM_ASM_001088 /TAXON_ID=426623 /ORGANISM="Chaetoceros affinis, Strain CCMP159" /LENGTH=525 /DNA_ID=CAMNT_0050543985 /DNA_START=96 /DNA_END=1673 /DNA_ORIENTATION=-